MSDFPMSGSFQAGLSKKRIHSLKGCIPENSPPFVVKKEKDQYIYDIDGNKYADFSLHSGSVICGHNFKTITRFVKNGIPAGTSQGFVDKFRYPLVKFFRTFAGFDYISFYGSAAGAFAALAAAAGPETIGVTSSWLFENITKALPGIKVEMAMPDREYGLLFFEPIDFEGDLGDFDPGNYRAKCKCSVESRTAFRLKNGFSFSLKDADYILCGPVIANGMDSAVILSGSKLGGENIPPYKSIAILETVKYYFRSGGLQGREFKISSGKISFLRGSIFRTERSAGSAELLKRGVWLDGNTGFFCMQHTENDIKRLERALNGD